MATLILVAAVVCHLALGHAVELALETASCAEEKAGIHYSVIIAPWRTPNAPNPFVPNVCT